LPLLDLTGSWFRIHRCHYEPLYFGRTGENRFDSPGGEYGILYCAGDAHGAFIETFGDLGRHVLTMSHVAERCLSRIEAARPLAVVDLTGPGLARLGADERLCAGDHAVAQRWALALWAHSSHPDGLYYRARHDPSRFCLALYDRAADAVRASRQGSLLEPANTALLADILEVYNFGLIDDTV
jgi:hypothetical protein